MGASKITRGFFWILVVLMLSSIAYAADIDPTIDLSADDTNPQTTVVLTAVAVDVLDNAGIQWIKIYEDESLKDTKDCAGSTPCTFVKVIFYFTEQSHSYYAITRDNGGNEKQSSTINVDFQGDEDQNQTTCTNSGNIWFTAYTGGSNYYCCGDDGNQDDFYHYDDPINSCHFCDDGSEGNDTIYDAGTNTSTVCYIDEACDSTGSIQLSNSSFADCNENGENISNVCYYGFQTNACVAGTGWTCTDGASNSTYDTSCYTLGDIDNNTCFTGPQTDACTTGIGWECTNGTSTNVSDNSCDENGTISIGGDVCFYGLANETFLCNATGWNCQDGDNINCSVSDFINITAFGDFETDAANCTAAAISQVANDSCFIQSAFICNVTNICTNGTYKGTQYACFNDGAYYLNDTWAPPTEIIDGLDNDCDNSTDEGLTAPWWSNNATAILATYSPLVQSLFNITWQDDLGVDTIYLESDYSGAATNYSMTLLSGDVLNGNYSYTAILPAGTFYWKSYANDTQNLWNVTDTWAFTIAQAATQVNLTLNGIEANLTVTYPAQITAAFWTNALTAVMYRDGTDVSSENNTAVSLPTGVYNYTVINTGNQNYTGSIKTFFATMQQNTTACSLIFNPLSLPTYGTAINASCSCTNPEINVILYRNATDVTAENNLNVTLAAGDYGYVCNISATQNYTAATNTSLYTINKVNSVINLTLNGTDGNYTINQGSSIPSVATLITPGSGNVEIHFNGNQVGAGASPLTDNSLYNTPGTYNITAVFQGHENATAAVDTHWLTVIDTEAPVWNPIPSNQTEDHGNNLFYDVNANDNVAVSTYFINDNANFTINGTTGLISNGTVLGIGDYLLSVSVNDTSNNINSSIITITIQDITTPIWTVIPANAIIEYFFEALNVDFDATDSLLDQYFIDDTVRFNITSNGGELTNKTLTPLGVYPILVSVNDTSNNVNSTVYQVTVQDTIAPRWNETLTNQAEQYENSFSYDVNITEELFDQYFINDTVNFAIDVLGVITNATNLSRGNYHLLISANDTSNNVNSSAIVINIFDTIAPNAITNLANQSAGSSWIYWNWSNPVDDDFSQAIIFIDGVNLDNTSNNFYNATGLVANSTYNITVHTKDTSGNVNNTDVSDLANTTIDNQAPTIILTSPANGAALGSGTTSVVITLTTDEWATCRFNITNTTWGNMVELDNTNSTSHNFTRQGLSDGTTYNYHFLCEDNYSNIMINPYHLQFSVSSATPPPPPSSCFPAGTKILMVDGSNKNIEDIKIGDNVIGFDGNINIPVEVLELESPVRDHMYTLHFEDGTKLDLTEEHPLYTEDGWKSISPEATTEENAQLYVKELKESDSVLNAQGEFVKIINIDFEEKTIQTYNLKKVSKYNNFFANGFLAHNKGGSSSSCTESWTCIPWSECYANGTQTRTCTDSKNCRTTRYKPAELQNCTYIASTPTPVPTPTPKPKEDVSLPNRVWKEEVVEEEKEVPPVTGRFLFVTKLKGIVRWPYLKYIITGLILLLIILAILMSGEGKTFKGQFTDLKKYIKGLKKKAVKGFNNNNLVKNLKK